VTAECKINNDDWAEGLHQLTGFTWPSVSGPVMFKQFLVFKRGETGPANLADTEAPGKESGCLGSVALLGLWALVAGLIVSLLT